MNDLVIRDARICDGTGAPGVRGDVGVLAGRIAQVGGTVERGTREVDAGGLVLAPGIIDSHTHYDAQITWDPQATPSVALGVTTVVMGNCGFTIAPCRPAHRERTLRNLTQVEGMSLDALLTGTRWEFESFPEYLGALERQGVVPNVAAYAGHSSLRTWVMGDAATERTATDAEIAAMQAELANALRAGAVGFATSTFEMHNGAGGVPMPSRFADERELRALAATLGAERKGLFMLTKGNRTTIPFLESLAAQNGRPVMIAAMQYDPSDPTRVFNELRQIHEARERRRTLYAQVGCTPVTFDLSLTGVYMFEGLPSWKSVIPLYQDKAALARAYADPQFRAAVKADLAVPHRLNQFSGQWNHLEIVRAGKPQHRHLEMRNIADLAAAERKHPLDWFLDFGIAEDFETLFNVQIMNADDAQVKRLLADPYSSIALSDAGAHLSLFCDAGFGLYLFGHWSRERGDFTLEDAVYQVTGKPAAIYGIADRGRIAPGCWADLLLFDPATVQHGPKEQVRDLPGGALRLIRKPVGVHGVWVNGVQVADAAGETTGAARPGRVLRSFAA